MCDGQTHYPPLPITIPNYTGALVPVLTNPTLPTKFPGLANATSTHNFMIYVDAPQTTVTFGLLGKPTTNAGAFAPRFRIWDGGMVHDWAAPLVATNYSYTFASAGVYRAQMLLYNGGDSAGFNFAPGTRVADVGPFYSDSVQSMFPFYFYVPHGVGEVAMYADNVKEPGGPTVLDPTGQAVALTQVGYNIYTFPTSTGATPTAHDGEIWSFESYSSANPIFFFNIPSLFSFDPSQMLKPSDAP
jgi:hypothetical protein